MPDEQLVETVARELLKFQTRHHRPTFGLKPSRAVGELKKAVMESILDGVITNEMEPALAFLLQQGAAKGLAPEGGLVHSPN